MRDLGLFPIDVLARVLMVSPVAVRSLPKSPGWPPDAA
jgi:hypothetical protein